MIMVTSQFIAGKTLDVEPVQVLIGPRSVLEIRSKNAHCAGVHIHPGIKNASIGKKSN